MLHETTNTLAKIISFLECNSDEKFIPIYTVMSFDVSESETLPGKINSHKINENYLELYSPFYEIGRTDYSMLSS